MVRTAKKRAKPKKPPTPVELDAVDKLLVARKFLDDSAMQVLLNKYKELS